MSADDIRYFNGTCEEFDLSTCKEGVLNIRFLDPCSCRRYYQCTNSYKMMAETCPKNTLWDSNLNQCNHEHEVRISQTCESHNSWKRCNTTEERRQQLEQICANTVTSTAVPTTGSPIETTTAAPPSGSSGTNIGLIVGLTLTSVVVLVLIVLFILYRRKHRSGLKKKRGTTTHNPEYYENGNQDDPYAVIDDRMHNAAYGAPVQRHTNGGFSNTGYSLSLDDDITYDNSVVRTQESGYTSTLNRSFREYGNVTNTTSQQTTSDGTLTTTENQHSDVVYDVPNKMPSTNLDENGNRSSDSSNNDLNVGKKDEETSRELNDGDSKSDGVTERNSNELSEETMHDYLVLNPEHL